MPGLLSNVFGADENEGGITQSAQASELGGHLDISPTISLQSEMSGSYQDLEGTTHEWSHESELTISLDVTGTLALATESLESSAEG